MTDRLLTDEWQDGFDACEFGATMWECPYDDNTPEARNWLSGWMACDFDDRVNQMETEYVGPIAT